MFPIQPRRGRQRDEKLTSIGVLPTVGHAQDPRACVFQRSVDLVFEFVPVDTRAAAPCACGVTSLDHEVGDDSVEDDAVVVVSLRQGREVLACFGCVVIVQLDCYGTLGVIVSIHATVGLTGRGNGKVKGCCSLVSARTHHGRFQHNFGRHGCVITS